jgi:AcrR family transcriptional regulator
MPPEERRATILAAARPLLLEHGRGTSTRLIAEAAGVAEGTLFRVFPTKDSLIDAVIEEVFDPTPFLDSLEHIDLSLPLHDRLVEAITLLQQRFASIFQMMIALAVPRPPASIDSAALRKRLANGGLGRVIAPDADRFRVPPDEVVRMLRLLTFSGSHPHIADQRMLRPDEIVDLVLHGTLRPESPEEA